MNNITWNTTLVTVLTIGVLAGFLGQVGPTAEGVKSQATPTAQAVKSQAAPAAEVVKSQAQDVASDKVEPITQGFQPSAPPSKLAETAQSAGEQLKSTADSFATPDTVSKHLQSWLTSCMPIHILNALFQVTDMWPWQSLLYDNGVGWLHTSQQHNTEFPVLATKLRKPSQHLCRACA